MGNFGEANDGGKKGDTNWALVLSCCEGFKEGLANSSCLIALHVKVTDSGIQEGKDCGRFPVLLILPDTMNPCLFSAATGRFFWQCSSSSSEMASTYIGNVLCLTGSKLLIDWCARAALG